MDRLFSMEVFVRVVEQGGFSAAGKALGLSPTMAGNHVRFLEDRLGTRLLNRTTRRQGLTEAGRLYLEHCKVLLGELSAAEASVQGLRQKPRGLLRVSSPVTFGAQRLAPLLAEYLSQQPEVRVELMLNDVAEDLIEGNFDVAIRIGKLADSRLVACPLKPYRTVVAASPAYLASRGRPRSPAELARHNCLGFSHWDRPRAWSLAGAGKRKPVPVRGNFTSNHGQALRMAALAGAGIVMQPEVLLADDLSAGKLVALLPGHAPRARPVHLVYLAERSLTPKLRSFVDLVVSRCGIKAREDVG